MPYPISIEIVDHNRVLCELDRYQIENMIWLRLAPQQESVISVRFEISVMENRHASSAFARDYIASITTNFRGGKKSIAVAHEGTTLLASMRCVDQMVEAPKLPSPARPWPNSIGQVIAKTNHAASRSLAISSIHE